MDVVTTCWCLGTTSNTRDPSHNSIQCMHHLKTAKEGIYILMQVSISWIQAVAGVVISILGVVFSQYLWTIHRTSASCNIQIKVQPRREVYKVIICRKSLVIKQLNRSIIMDNTCHLTLLGFNKWMQEMNTYRSIIMRDPLQQRQTPLTFNNLPITWEEVAVVWLEKNREEGRLNAS